jgi:hypothetical protein
MIYTVKRLAISRPQPGCHLPNPPWPRIIKTFPARESLVNDIPAGDGKIINLFLQCTLAFFHLDICRAGLNPAAGLPGYEAHAAAEAAVKEASREGEHCIYNRSV